MARDNENERLTDDHEFTGELIDLCEKFEVDGAEIDSLALTGLDFFIELVRHTHTTDEEAKWLIDDGVTSIFQKPSHRQELNDE